MLIENMNTHLPMKNNRASQENKHLSKKMFCTPRMTKIPHLLGDGDELSELLVFDVQFFLRSPADLLWNLDLCFGDLGRTNVSAVHHVLTAEQLTSLVINVVFRHYVNYLQSTECIRCNIFVSILWVFDTDKHKFSFVSWQTCRVRKTPTSTVAHKNASHRIAQSSVQLFVVCLLLCLVTFLIIKDDPHRFVVLPEEDVEYVFH